MPSCPQCGYENQQGTDFCGQCNSYLAWPEASPESPSQLDKARALAARVAGEEPPAVRPTRSPDAPPPPPAAGERVGVAVSLAPAQLRADPGGETSSEIRVRNTGTIVDQFSLEILGGAAAWATIEPPLLNLYPGTDPSVAMLRFRPPRSAGTRAGPAPFKVRAVSKENPAISEAVDGVLEIAPYADLSAELVPHGSRGRFSARHVLRIHNQGNTPVTCAVSGADPDEQLAFSFVPTTVASLPGTQAEAQVRVRPRRWLWLGLPRLLLFSVTARTDGQTPLQAQGQMQQLAIIPRWLARLAMIAVPVVGALLAFLLLTAEVPQVVNLPKAEAEAQIQSVGFQFQEIGEASDTVGPGRVIRTDPQASSRKRKGTTVSVVASAGRNPVAIPNVNGLPAAVASFQLQGKGLVVSQVAQGSDTVAAGNIVSTDPLANTLVAPGSAVKLNVSSGSAGKIASPSSSPTAANPPPTLVKVPSCAGLAASDCDARLKALGFGVREAVQRSNAVAPGKVIATDPAAGTDAAKGSAVLVIVSGGFSTLSPTVQLSPRP
jgi:beta-lactam-binding protein with PASTA domain